MIFGRCIVALGAAAVLANKPNLRLGARSIVTKRYAVKAPAKVSKRKSTRVHLIDALPYIFRAYYSLPLTMADSKGRQSNALQGFATFLLTYIKLDKPTHMALCFDKTTNPFRKELDPNYKSTRKPAPEELKEQIGRCREFAESLGVACFDDARYEADDLLATLSTSMIACGHDCVVVGPDKDLCQLVGPQVSMYDFAKGIRHDEDGVMKKMGVRPCQITDFLGLMGDACDCIPGVKGVGVKTAVSLLEQFNDLEDLYANLDTLESKKFRGASKLRQRLTLGQDEAFRSRTLATCVRKVPMKSAGFKALEWKRPAMEQLHPMLEDFGLGGLRSRLEQLLVSG